MTEEQKSIWDAEASRVDKAIAKYTDSHSWNQYLPQRDTEDFNAFCRHLMYVISKFLEEEDSRELFIEIPIEEFANKLDSNDTLQITRWKNIAETIMANLMLSTIGTICDKTFIQDTNAANDRDKFLMFDTRGNSHLVRRRGNQLIDANNQRTINGVPLELGLIKVCCNFTLNARNRNQLYIESTQLKDKYLCLASKKSTKQYLSAALVSYNNIAPSTDNIGWKSNCIDIPIQFTSNYQEVTNRDANYDIIIVLGDEKYRNVANRYRNTRAKKLIFIGSESPFNGIDTYSFTFREIYRYCGPAELNAPKCVELEFPWLDAKRQELKELLEECKCEDDTLTDSVIEKCVNRLTSPFTNALFDEEKLAKLKEFNDEFKIGDYLDRETDPETIDKAYLWYQNLTFDETNPKKTYFSEHQENLNIAKWRDSYRNRVKALPGNNDSIILDAPSLSIRDERYLYILRHHMFADITALYYKGVENLSKKSLESFFLKELARYNDPIRQRYGTNYNFDVQAIEVAEEFDIDKYFEDEYNSSYSVYNTVESTQYTVTFEDRSTANIDGEILVDFGKGFERINISDLQENPNHKFPAKYYSSPLNLAELMLVGFNFPEEISNKIDDYSAMWKQAYQKAFKRYSKSTKKETISEIYNKCKISKNCLYLYSTETENQFLQSKSDMEKMCDFLISEGFLPEGEKNHIMKAREFNGKYKSFGRNLKNIVYAIALNEDEGEDGAHTLNKEQLSIYVSLLAKYSKNDLLDATLKSNKISKISKIKISNQ